MGGLNPFSKPKVPTPPPPPPVPEPAPMPVPDDERVEIDQRKRAARRIAQSGRSSTQLGQDQPLGG